jgi:L-ascorbate metabolism protein UlaG (beta-lactamase superfamily)
MEVLVMQRLLGLAVVLLIGVGALAADVTVSYLGHSCFTIRAGSGPVVMLDPYGTYVPYLGLPAPADVVLMTHGHIDHCPDCYGEKDRVEGSPIKVYLLDGAGRCREKIPPAVWTITDEFATSAIEGSHVTASGGGQGSVCIFVFNMGGIRFAHLGDLGRTLTSAQISALSDVEVLFVPVGGAFTLNAPEAMAVLAQLPSVRVAFPMHYYVAGYTPWREMAPLSEFTTLAGAAATVRLIGAPSIVLSSDGLPDSTEIWVLDYTR